MSLPAYPSYKDSGVPWLQRVPWDWAVVPLKHAARVFPSNVDKHSHENEMPVRLCNYTDVYYNDRVDAQLTFMEATATPEEIRKFTLHQGDTIITKDSETADDIGRSAYVAESMPGVLCGYHLSVIRPNDRLEGRFIKRLFDSSYLKAVMEVNANGLTRVGLGQYAIDNLDIPLPPLEDQVRIADFLDDETAKIGALITKQTQLIATLREDRSAIIANAIGVQDPVKLRRLVDPQRPMTYGILQCGDPVEDGVPYIGPSDMPGKGESPSLDSLRRTTHEIAATYSRSVLAGGDIVVSIGPAYGRVAIVDSVLKGANLTQDTVRVAALPSLVDARYLVWVLLSPGTAQFWDSQIMGATFRRLNLGTLASTPIPLPSLHEQRRIVAELDGQTAAIDGLVCKADQLIGALLEYRSALITDAVTGKIDVRGVA